MVEKIPENWMIADLHIHSKYSRATSPYLSFEALVKWAKIKGLHLLGTGDFTHPKWFEEIKKLKSNDKGFYYFEEFPFIISGEISLMYSDGGKGRRIHLIVLVPNIGIAERINSYFDSKGRRDYDGRPIFNISADEFVREMKKISKDIEVIPAHIWTPWFSLFGSMSGFDTVEECFKDQTKHIFAMETGLSSDPEMNWRLSQLDKYALVSNSDLHSFWPWRIGREANVFEMRELSYKEFIGIIHEKNPKRFLYTIEVDPSYGKYHYDGHRACNVCMNPSEAIKRQNRCPVCGRQLTIGVMHRVEELADRPEGYKPEGAIPFKSLIPLSEVISNSIGVSQPFSKKVWAIYSKLIDRFGSELNVLLEAPKDEMAKVADDKLASVIMGIRNGEIEIKPGYDGVYGYPVFGKENRPKGEEGPQPMPLDKQKNLMEF